MQTFLQDLRYGFRTLLRNPGFTLIAIIALALGIGANTAIFSIVHAVVISPLPYQEPDRIVWIWGYNPQTGALQAAISPPDFIDYRNQSQSFEQLAAFGGQPGGINLTGEAEPERVDGLAVSADFFETLGVRPMMGRTFQIEEEQAGPNQVVMISYALWQRRFGADPEIIGKALTINGAKANVIGVMGRDFEFPVEAELWVPLPFNIPNMSVRSAHFLRAIARLKPGVTIEQAQMEMETITAGLSSQYPESNTDYGARLVPLHERIVGNIRLTLFTLFGAVGFVLLIACANVANLLLARAASRQKEVAIRMALGASRGRIVRQMLTESLLLSAMGGSAGLLLALWGVDLLRAISPGNIPRFDEVSINGQVLGFSLAISILTGVIFGLVPALQASKPDLNESLKEGGKSSSMGAGRARARNILVVAEVALALVLLIGTGLLIKSFIRLQSVEPGFDPANVLTMQISLPGAKYREDHQYVAFYEQLLREIEMTGGVQSAGAVSELPLTRQRNDSDFTIEGRAPLPTGKKLIADMRTITPNYFSAMGIPLLRGRAFESRDNKNAPRVAIINDAMAREFWPGEDVLGKRIKIGRDSFEIVGEVRGVRHRGPSGAPFREVYLAYYQSPRNSMNLVVRTSTDPMSMSAAVRDHVLAIDKDQPVSGITAMEELLSNSIAQPRFNMLLLAIFAFVALMLAVVGIYGVMNYSVTQRTHEIGIRMALGADNRHVFKLIVGKAFFLAVTGVAIGSAAAFALTRLMSSMLYEVSATDPVTFASISLLLTVVALLASYLPARRATKVDPGVALRCE